MVDTAPAEAQRGESQNFQLFAIMVKGNSELEDLEETHRF